MKAKGGLLDISCEAYKTLTFTAFTVSVYSSTSYERFSVQ